MTLTDELVAAVAKESASGRLLIVATTNLDREETVIWDMGAIAAHGGLEARELFRNVLVASASVPVLIAWRTVWSSTALPSRSSVSWPR